MPKTVKLVLLGEQGAGKTALRARFISGEKPVSSYQQTKGADSQSKELNIDNELLTLSIWDFPGEQQLFATTEGFLNNAEAILLVVSPKHKETQEAFLTRVEKNIKDTRESIAAQCGDDYKANFVLVWSKTDLLSAELSKEALVPKLKEIAQKKALYADVFAVSAIDSTEAEIAAPFIVAAKLANQKVQEQSQDLVLTPFNEQNRATNGKSIHTPLWRQFLNFVNGVLGLIFGAVLGMVFSILYCNPITVFYTVVRGLVALYSNKDTHKAIPIVLTVLSPLLAVGGTLLAALLGLSIGISEGWREGCLEGISMPWRILATLTSHKHVDDPKLKVKFSSPVLVHPADIVVGVLLSLIVAGVVLGILFPPAWLGIASLLPTAITTLGLTGIPMSLIAAMAGIATFSVVSLAYAAAYALLNCFVNPPSYKVIDTEKGTVSTTSSLRSVTERLPTGVVQSPQAAADGTSVHAAPASPLLKAAPKQPTGDQGANPLVVHRL